MQAIQPIGESRSDYEAVAEVARKLGLYEEYTEGKTNEELEKAIFNFTGAQKVTSWKEFKEKEYCVLPIAEDWEKDPAGLLKFYEDPQANPLPTPTGKLEIYSESLAMHFPDDRERQPIPKWVEKSEMHDERLSSLRAKVYPLLMVSNHGHWRVHAQCDDIPWTREVMSCKIKGFDGYMYEPVWLHPSDAARRGIKTGDLVKVFNERGTVLGGAIDLLAPDWLTSRYCDGMATSSFLVDVEKVTMAEMEEWRKLYPEVFAREYDPACGLRFNAWVTEGGK